MGIKFVHHGNFSKTEKFFRRSKDITRNIDLDKYGQAGVEALREYTPKDTGLTANSWYYEIVHDADGTRIIWSNSNLGEGWAPIAILLQFGHATGNGGFVEGQDYINPALRPIFNELAEQAWKEMRGR